MSDDSQNKKIKDKSTGFFNCRKRDRGASEDRLLAAGLEVFSKFGFGGSTTKMIAKKADVNESLIARYFEGKKGLLIAIVKRFINQVYAQELPYPPQDNFLAEISSYANTRLTEGCEHEDFAHIIISQALVDRKFKKTVRDSAPMQLDPRLIARVQRLADMGKLKPGFSAADICTDLNTFMDGIFFFDRILHETPIEELLVRTQNFLKRYSQLVQA